MKRLFAILPVLIIVTGCQVTEPQYYYGTYANNVYGFFKADEVSIDDQILALEEVVSQAESMGKPIAPGIHAHLGMLYFESGNAEKGVVHLQHERALFPESQHYIDFLLASHERENS